MKLLIGLMPSRKRTQTPLMITPYFDVRQSDIQGLGAFATKVIRKGQRVIEYTGEHISDEEADRRYDESKMRRHHTFLFTLNSKTVVDGAVGGGAAIYINHACEPNCEAVITGKRIYVHALRTIHPGEELLYDYQYERTDETDEEQAKFYKCLCGTSNCRGTIMMPAKPQRKPRKQKAAAGKTPAGRKRTKKVVKKGVKKGASR